MPRTRVVFYKDRSGEAPALEWLGKLRRRDAKAWANCVARVRQLAAYGYELRRPVVDYLRDGIYELRAKHRHVQYRILYFFHGRDVAVLAHGIVKSGAAVPHIDIERAIVMKRAFEIKPAAHTFEMELGDA